MKKIRLFSVGIIILSFILAIFFYGKLPDQLASHWNSSGDVNGYISKFWGLFLLPIMSLVFFLIFSLIPIIDPLKENINKFRAYFDIFIFILLLFLFYIYLLTIFWNLGYRFDMNLMIVPAISIFFYFIGIILTKSKRNWFIGIRTPWTLSNEIVWDKTNKLGGKMFKIIAIIIFFGIFIGHYYVFLIVFPVIFSVIYLLIYSYFEFKKQSNNKK